MYFPYFVIISRWKRSWPFIWTNLNSIHPRMLCVTFSWNWPSSSSSEDFFNSVNVGFFWSPLKKYGCLLNRLELPSPKDATKMQDAFCQVWLKLSQWCLRRSFQISSMYFRYYICNYLQLEKGMAHYLNKLAYPSPTDALCWVWLKLAQWILRRRWKCESL